MSDDVLVTSVKRIINTEHGYGWEIMPNPDAPDYGVTIFYYEPSKMAVVGFNDADGNMCFSTEEAKEIGRALIHIAEDIEATKRRQK